VQPAPRFANARDELALDKAMHVFVGAVHPRRIASALVENRVQPVANKVSVFSRQRSARDERLSPRQTAGHIVFEEPSIERKRDAEIEGGRIRRAVEST
jgi:hypothetical protein